MANAYTHPQHPIYLGVMKAVLVHFSVDTYVTGGFTLTTGLSANSFMVACSPVTYSQDYLIMVDNVNHTVKLFSLATNEEIDTSTITAASGDILVFGH